MTVTYLMSNWVPGSYEQPWSWEDELKDILDRECLCCGVEGHYQTALEDHMRSQGVFWSEGQIILGEDGRVWDGHHRILAAYRLGWFAIPVDRMKVAYA